MTENYMCPTGNFQKGVVRLNWDRCMKKVENHVLEGTLFTTVAITLGIFFVA